MKISVPRLGTVVKIFLGSVTIIYIVSTIYIFNKLLGTNSISQPIHPSLTELSEVTGLSFPANAQLMAFEFESAMDTSVFATIDMSSDDLAAFLAANKIDPSNLKRGGTPMLDVESWTPARSNDLVSAQIQRGPVEQLI